MRFQKGQSGNPKGKKKGVVHKRTKNAREAFDYAFQESGGGEALATWAKANRTEFYKLFARLIPVDVDHSGSVIVEIVRFADSSPG